MSTDLVIVESPAKAKTIERYLGPGYTVLASYGHVRDLPENLGKDQLGVDVEHDFAPTYEIVAGPPQAGGRDREGRPRRPIGSTSRPTSTARARPSPGTSPRPSTCRRSEPPRVTFNEITEPAHPRGVRPPARDRPGPRRRPAGPPDRRPAGRLHAESAALAQGPVGPVGRPRPVGRRPPRRRSRTRDPGVHAPSSTGRSRRSSSRRAGATFSADLVRIDGEKPVIGDAETADRHVAALQASRPVVDSIAVEALEAQPGAAVHDVDAPAGGEPQARLQPEADDVGRPAPVRGPRDRRTARSASSPTCGPTRSRCPGRRWARRARSSATATATTTRCPRAARSRRRRATPRRRTRRSGRRRSGAIPSRWPRCLRRDEARLYRLIWQRALASQMKEKELETTTVELSAGGLRAAGERPRRPCSTASARVYTEGQDDAADEHERALPPLAEGDVTTVAEVTPTQHFTEPPPRFTEATLIKALEEHGIGRPSTYAATISTIVDRGYVTVVGAAAPPGAGRRDRDRPAGRSLRGATSTSSSPPGWRRSSTRSPAATATGCRSCATSTARSRSWSTRSATSSAGATSRPAIRRGLLAKATRW